jgi:hypothetical protein
MAYRYCPGCEKWLQTYEYTLDETGELVCPEHQAVHGYIGPYGNYTERDFRKDNKESMYDDFDEMLQSAYDQMIIE